MPPVSAHRNGITHILAKFTEILPFSAHLRSGALRHHGIQQAGRRCVRSVEAVEAAKVGDVPGYEADSCDWTPGGCAMTRLEGQ